MIGMSFASFVALLILGFTAAIIMHSAIHYRMVAGVDGLIAKWIAGWIGAWLGTPCWAIGGSTFRTSTSSPR